MATQNEKQAYVPQNQNDEASIDIKQLVYIFLNNWYLFAIGAVVALVAAFLINRYTTNIYQARGTVIVKEGRTVDPTSIMTSGNFSNSQNLDNELATLKSYTLRERVVKKMNAEVTYMDKGRLKDGELYKRSPFTVEFDNSVPQAVNLVYKINFIDTSTFVLTANSEFLNTYDFLLGQNVKNIQQKIAIESKHKQGDWIDNGYNRIRIVLNEGITINQLKDKNLTFWLNSYPSLVRQMSNFTAAPNSKSSSVVAVTMSGPNKQKIVDFINLLMNEYVSRGLERKNLVSENTVQFINAQLGDIEQSLSTAENALKDFRTRNDLMNLDQQASQVYNTLRTLDKERSEKNVSLMLYKRLQNYIQSQIDDPENLAAPSTMGISDPLLERLVQQLVTLSQTKATQLLTLTEQHPQIVKIDEQIVTTKRTLLETVNQLVQNSEMGLKELDKRIARTEAESKVLPEKERQLINYQRNFSFNDDTYKYLMQRRAEAQILRASNTPDNEVLDEARIDQTFLIKPRSSMNYLIALILGLLIPALYLFLKDFFNVNVNNRKDIEKLTKYPIIGQVAMTDSKSPLVVVNSPKAPISESFRAIRTNIEYITQNKEQTTIVVTGDTQGIGKTFNSINLASIYALYGKKTILLGFDLRKPRIYQDFGITNNVGISSYLSNKEEKIDSIIQTSSALPSLDIITAGPPS